MSVRSSHSPQSTFCVCVCVEFHVCCRFWKLHLWYLLYLLYRPFPFSFISLFVMGWRRRCRQPLPLAVQPVCALSRSVWSLLWRAAMSSSSKIIKQHECFSSVHLHTKIPSYRLSRISISNIKSQFYFSFAYSNDIREARIRRCLVLVGKCDGCHLIDGRQINMKTTSQKTMKTLFNEFMGIFTAFDDEKNKFEEIISFLFVCVNFIRSDNAMVVVVGWTRHVLRPYPNQLPFASLVYSYK